MKYKTKFYLVFPLFFFCLTPPLLAVPINSDVALTPAEGVTLVRNQIRFASGESVSSSSSQDINQVVISNVLVHGVREDLAVFASLPVVSLEIEEDSTSGLGEMTFLGKLRIYRKDEPLKTTRVALFGGVETPTGREDFSSDSFDPILGAVYTQQTLNSEFDADFIYKWNTGGGVFSFDSLFYDMAYQFRIWPPRHPEKGVPAFLNLVAELNGFYSTRGSHLLFLSPGIQYVDKRFIVESSIQLPVVQDQDKNEFEADFILSGGIRIQF